MREIKFRAWCFTDKKMSRMCGYFEHHPYNDANKYAWMQYSGLKDKNGIEIYEGDVVYIAGYGDYLCEFPFYELYDGDTGYDIGEVKGNIYENPELLEK